MRFWDVLMACWLVLTLGVALRSTLHGRESLYVGKTHRSPQLENEKKFVKLHEFGLCFLFLVTSPGLKNAFAFIV
jgi:hypothetical protein